MDDINVRRREIFFNNLILLGLDKTSLEGKHGITFHKDMFVLPNKKGYEIVTHFLFSKLSSITGEEYNMPWPLVCREHDRTFQKACYSNLMNFSQEKCIRFPRIVPSLLSTFGGDRFYEVYLAFSSYVLYKTIKKKGDVTLLSVPVVNRENFNTAKEILQLSTTLKMKRFQETEIMSYESYNIFLKFAKILEECLGKLKNFLKFCEESIKKNKSSILTLYPTLSDENLKLSSMLEMSYNYLKPILKQRKILDNFLSSEQIYWQHLCSEVGENAESVFLNGHDYNILVTDHLPEKYVNELKNTGCLTSNENGKLSVEKFIKIFTAYLKFIVELLKNANLPDLHKRCFVEDTPCIEDDLQCIKKLNIKLSNEVTPCAKTNIERLKITTGYDDDGGEENLELLNDQFWSLPVPSFDMEAVKQRAPHFDTNLEKIFSKSQMCNKTRHDLVTQPGENPSEQRFTTVTDRNLASTSSFFFTPVFSRKTTIVNTELGKTHLNDDANTMNIANADSSSISKVNLSSLDDLHFYCSSHFKMRKSWLEEESLNTMALPDMFFDEELEDL